MIAISSRRAAELQLDFFDLARQIAIAIMHELEAPGNAVAVRRRLGACEGFPANSTKLFEDCSCCIATDVEGKTSK
jgi:hypothetical protein